MTRVFSGVKPTGHLTLGNYLGAMRRWAEVDQYRADALFCVVDLHALTVDHAPARVRRLSRQAATLLLASGLEDKASDKVVGVLLHMLANKTLRVFHGTGAVIEGTGDEKGGGASATTTSQGVTNPAVHGYNPIALAGHPGTFLLLACLGSVVVWRLAGVWKQGAWGTVWRGAVRQAWKSSPSVVLLASVAGVLVDTGMVRTVARGAAAATGHAYPAMAPLVGALGSIITGSTTSSNALFSALQREVAQLIGDRPADLLAGQLAGGNIGNSLAPVVILLGLSAVGSVRSAGQVLRMTLLPAAVLLLSVVVTTLTLVALH